MATKLPSIRIHKPTKQYIVNHQGKRHYLGPWSPLDKKPPQSVQVAFASLLGRLLSISEEIPQKPDFWQRSMTISELVQRFMVSVQEDRPHDIVRWKSYLRALLELYADWPVKSFGPSRMLKVQDRMIAQGHSRTGTNHNIGKIRQLFSWGVAREYVEPEMLLALKTIPPVKFGRAHETSARGMVEDSIVDETIPHLPPQLQSMVQIQRITGMRPGEVCSMTTGQIDRSRQVWWFRPVHHKTLHRGKERMIPLGPKAQELLAPWLRADPDKPLFCPKENQEDWREGRRKAGKAPLDSRKRKRTQPTRYTTGRYGQIIRAVCLESGIPLWSPNQLRKAAAQSVLETLGIDHARALLGHSTTEVTRHHYLTQEMAKAEQAALKIG